MKKKNNIQLVGSRFIRPYYNKFNPCDLNVCEKINSNNYNAVKKFKCIDSSNLKNIENDDLIIKTRSLLEFKNAKIIGSYIRYGKLYAAGIDMCEELNINISDISNLINKYFNNLKNNEKNIFITKLTFDIIDQSIYKLICNLGYLDGLLQIQNSNININQIDEILPDLIKKEITKLILDYNKKNDIYSYINLYMFLKDNLQPFFTLDEAIKGKKEFHGKTIKLSDYKFTYMYIEIIYDNFKLSNFVYFKKKIKPTGFILYVELNDVLIDSTDQSNCKYQMSYYKLIKYFFHFLKKSYFNKIFISDTQLNSKTISLYNEIYDYREILGITNNNISKIENKIIINKAKKIDTTELKKEYKQLKIDFEIKCKEYFMQIAKPYFKYLKSYFQLI